MLKLELFFLLDLAIVITTLEARRPTKQRDVSKLDPCMCVSVCHRLWFSIPAKTSEHSGRDK